MGVAAADATERTNRFGHTLVGAAAHDVQPFRHPAVYLIPAGPRILHLGPPHDFVQGLCGGIGQLHHLGN